MHVYKSVRDNFIMPLAGYGGYTCFNFWKSYQNFRQYTVDKYQQREQTDLLKAFLACAK